MEELIDFTEFHIYDDGKEIHLLAPNKEVFDKTPACGHGISFEIFDENGLLDYDKTVEKIEHYNKMLNKIKNDPRGQAGIVADIFGVGMEEAEEIRRNLIEAGKKRHGLS
ncbi:hypothetical protein [Streptococcus suis]|uniref:hypothetical protein n=1 Tax=Streptococcus suis TaxID=1307 RepID=UPI0004210078|nr:hypothetical protein [Streptococcus suis]